MQGFFALGALAVMVGCVITRAAWMKKQGIRAFHFGEMDKKDFLIPPFVLLYLYLLPANVFGWPKFGRPMEGGAAAAWIGAALCVCAPVLFVWGLASFGGSFRVGIDMEKPGGLVRGGAFAVSRNPLYLAFFMVLGGVFLIFPCWTFFAYFVAGLWLIDRQVCLEENALRGIYGKEYDEYCQTVRRYL